MASIGLTMHAVPQRTDDEQKQFDDMLAALMPAVREGTPVSHGLNDREAWEMATHAAMELPNMPLPTVLMPGTDDIAAALQRAETMGSGTGFLIYQENTVAHVVFRAPDDSIWQIIYCQQASNAWRIIAARVLQEPILPEGPPDWEALAADASEVLAAERDW